jgi:hypothetical protein
MEPNGGPGAFWEWWDGRDVAGAPSGDLAITVGYLQLQGLLYPCHFLVRLEAGGNVLLAYSGDDPFHNANPRSVAVGNDGAIFASFRPDSGVEQTACSRSRPSSPWVV